MLTRTLVHSKTTFKFKRSKHDGHLIYTITITCYRLPSMEFYKEKEVITIRYNGYTTLEQETNTAELLRKIVDTWEQELHDEFVKNKME